MVDEVPLRPPMNRFVVIMFSINVGIGIFLAIVASPVLFLPVILSLTGFAPQRWAKLTWNHEAVIVRNFATKRLSHEDFLGIAQKRRGLNGISFEAHLRSGKRIPVFAMYSPRWGFLEDESAVSCRLLSINTAIRNARPDAAINDLADDAVMSKEELLAALENEVDLANRLHPGDERA